MWGDKLYPSITGDYPNCPACTLFDTKPCRQMTCELNNVHCFWRSEVVYTTPKQLVLSLTELMNATAEKRKKMCLEKIAEAVKLG